MIERPIRKALADVGIYFIFMVLASLSSFISIPIYTRIFNPIQYGYLSLTLITISLLGVFSYAEVSTSIVRFLPKYSGKKNEKIFYTTSLSLTLLCTFVVSTFYFVGLSIIKMHFNPKFFELLIFSVLVLIMSSLFYTFLSIFRANQNSMQYGLFTIFNKYISLFISLFLVIILSQGLIGVLLGSFVTLMILNGFIFVFFLGKKLS